MKDKIVDVLKEMTFDEQYKELYSQHHDIKNFYNLKRKEAEHIIKIHDSDFEYIKGDRMFMKEFKYGGMRIRHFLHFTEGMIEFSYALFKGEDNVVFRRGNLHALASMVDPQFLERIRSQCFIATSLEEAQYIIDRIFQWLNDFKEKLEEKISESDFS